MRFRFGWRKEQNPEKPVNENISETELPDQRDGMTSPDIALSTQVILNSHPEPKISPTRILFFGVHDEIGNLYSLFLRSKGYEVYHFPSHSACALITQQKCSCSREHVCADILITDMEMEGMTGIELIRHQRDRGCRTLPANKAVISKAFTNSQEYEARALGCKTLRKPFRLLDMMEWVKRCELKIPADRKLIPHSELLET